MRCCICIWAFSEEGVGTCKDRMEIRYGLVGIQQEECLLEIYNPTQDREACSPPTFPLIFIFLLHHQGIKEITLQDPSKSYHSLTMLTLPPAQGEAGAEPPPHAWRQQDGSEQLLSLHIRLLMGWYN